jgi:hypothetical protein
LLVEGLDDGSSLTRFVHDAKQASGFWFSQRNRTRLWQIGYHDRVLRSNEASIDVARYIVENPVRAGLVATPREYPYLGSEVYTMDELLASICRDR